MPDQVTCSAQPVPSTSRRLGTSGRNNTGRPVRAQPCSWRPPVSTTSPPTIEIASTPSSARPKRDGQPARWRAESSASGGHGRGPNSTVRTRVRVGTVAAARDALGRRRGSGSVRVEHHASSATRAGDESSMSAAASRACPTRPSPYTSAAVPGHSPAPTSGATAPCVPRAGPCSSHPRGSYLYSPAGAR